MRVWPGLPYLGVSMEARFRHWLKNKTIVTIVKLFFFSQLRVYITQFWLFNSQLQIYIMQF